jgi:hypothetical protein
VPSAAAGNSAILRTSRMMLAARADSPSLSDLRLAAETELALSPSLESQRGKGG